MECGYSVVLSDTLFHYLFRVMRCQNNETMTAFNGDGHYYRGTLHSLSKRTAEFRVTEKIAADNESNLRISLVQSLSKSDKMDTAIQKSVELGVTDIYPVRSEYSTVKLDEKRQEKKHQHWQSIIIAACEQSERATIPSLHPLQRLSDCLPLIEASDKIVLHPPRDPQQRSSALPKTTNHVAFLIGPEGGFSPVDINCATSNGFIRIGLGKRILRTETATVSALSLAQHLWGDW